MLLELYQNSWALVVGMLIFLIVWESVWKGLGLWFAAKNRQKSWFVAIFIFNTLGLLPIIYLLWFKHAPHKEGIGIDQARRIVVKKVVKTKPKRK